MTFQEYQQLALRTAPPPSPSHLEDLLHGALGVGTEGGELLDVVKKNQFYGKPIDWVNVREEIGDVLWYLALLARASHTTLEECGQLNIKKLEKRYPEKFSTECALCRDLDGERRVLEQYEDFAGKPFQSIYKTAEVVACFPNSFSEGEGISAIARSARENIGISRSTFMEWRLSLMKAGFIEKTADCRYRRTKDGDGVVSP